MCSEALHPAFDRDRFLLRQQLLALTGEKYYVWDEAGEVLLFMERPYHTLRSLAAVLAGTIAAGVVIVLGFLVASLLPKGAATAAVGGGGVLLGLVALVVVAVTLTPRRHLTIYRDDTKREPLLHIRQDHKWTFLRASYTVETPRGEMLGRLEKNYIYNLFRKRWYLYGPDGAVIVTAFEDSLLLSMLRRLLGPLFGVLRTNFIIALGEDDRVVVGEFNRKFTLLDRYVLDLTRDRERTLDRRLAVALGVMLDTGERR